MGKKLYLVWSCQEGFLEKVVPARSELRGARSTEIWDERRLVCARELLTGLVQALTRPRARRDGAARLRVPLTGALDPTLRSLNFIVYVEGSHRKHFKKQRASLVAQW